MFFTKRNFWNRNSTTVSLQIHTLLKTVPMRTKILKNSWKKCTFPFLFYIWRRWNICKYIIWISSRKLLQLRSSVSLCIVSTFPFWFYSICYYYYYFHLFPFLFAKQETEDKRFAYEWGYNNDGINLHLLSVRPNILPPPQKRV